MADKDEEQPARSFKVADRRRFADTESTDASAERDRDSVTESDRREEPTSAAPPHDHAFTGADAAYQDAAAPPAGEHDHGVPPEMTFSTFVIGLTTQALMHLGEIADPMQQQSGPDVPAAKQMIDLLGILREKTKGNLDDAETQLLDSMLYDLRLRYVEVARGR